MNSRFWQHPGADSGFGDIAAAELRLAAHAATAGALALIGLAAFFYAWKHRRSRKTDHEI